MKILRHKNLFGLIYAVMLAIPMVAVLSKVIYVQSNKNAYQSYSGTITTTYDSAVELNTNEVNTYEDLVIGNIYSIKSIMGSNNTWMTQNEYALPFKTITNQTLYIGKVNGPPTWKVYVDNTTYSATIYGADSVVQNIELGIIYNGELSTLNYQLEGQDIFTLSSYFPYSRGLNKLTYSKEVTTTSSTLDSVFEYAIDQTIEENNFGRIPFVNWLSGMFLDDNQVNNRYIHYTNWYMNYMLFVSTAYILFLVLMWFVNFARRLLERGMNYDF